LPRGKEKSNSSKRDEITGEVIRSISDLSWTRQHGIGRGGSLGMKQGDRRKGRYRRAPGGGKNIGKTVSIGRIKIPQVR